MARYTDDELQQIKDTIDLAALIRSKGIELSAHGSKDLKGLCPFHADTDPSLIVTPATNLFHCMSCGAGGDVIAFIQKHDGLSFRHAVELLKDSATHVLGETSARCGRVRKLPPPVEFDADDYQQLNQVIDYYHNCLLEAEPAQEYLRKRGLFDIEAIKAFKIGYADRSLGLRLPEKTRVAGKKVRTQLQKVGLIRESGHEHFNGCLVMPVIDDAGRITEVYGRKLARGKQKLMHLYLPGPHKGIWNPACLNGVEHAPQAKNTRSVILCEALIDALTFWVNGHRNVTASYGTQGFTPDHLAAFIAHKIQRVYIAYDRDQSGDAAAQALAVKLAGEGIKCYRVLFPRGMDANAYCAQVSPPGKHLDVLLHSAQFMDVSQGAAPTPGTPKLRGCTPHSTGQANSAGELSSASAKAAAAKNSPAGGPKADALKAAPQDGAPGGGSTVSRGCRVRSILPRGVGARSPRNRLPSRPSACRLRCEARMR